MARLINQEEGSGAPIFAFLHTYQIHSPYDPPVRYQSYFGKFDSPFVPSSENLIQVMKDGGPDISEADFKKIVAFYDGEIRFTDDQLCRFFEQLRATGFLEDCLVVVTSDHGEEFRDHGGFLHRGLLFDPFIHIPLIIQGNGVASGRIEDRLVSSIDIAPTILAHVGMARPRQMQGRNLLALPPAAPEEPVFAQFSRVRYALRTEKWNFIRTLTPPGVELYDLVADPWEQTDVSRERQGLLQLFNGILERWKNRVEAIQSASPAAPPTLTPQEKERLEALGYIGD